jgi:hypothetical protein
MNTAIDDGIIAADLPDQAPAPHAVGFLHHSTSRLNLP